MSKISANLDHKQKIFIPKKIAVLLFETVKNLIFWIVTHVSTRDYMVAYGWNWIVPWKFFDLNELEKAHLDLVKEATQRPNWKLRAYLKD